MGWIEGRFWFNNTRIEEVFKEMERQFNISIAYQDTTQRYYTGYFSNKNLIDALELVCEPMQLQYSVTKDNVTIK
jgi:transmembrane sensor